MNYPQLGITPSDLGDHPELAVLQILDSTLGIAKFAIIAAHPELTETDPAAIPSDLKVLAAEHVMIAADALQRFIASYRSVINAEGAWAQPSWPGPADDSF